VTRILLFTFFFAYTGVNNEFILNVIIKSLIIFCTDIAPRFLFCMIRTQEDDTNDRKSKGYESEKKMNGDQSSVYNITIIILCEIKYHIYIYIYIQP
jgi:hypothetical protein